MRSKKKNKLIFYITHNNYKPTNNSYEIKENAVGIDNSLFQFQPASIANHLTARLG